MSASAELRNRIFRQLGTRYPVEKGEVIAVQEGTGAKHQPTEHVIFQGDPHLVVARYKVLPGEESTMIDVIRGGHVIGEEIAMEHAYRSSAVALNSGEISLVRLDQLLADSSGKQLLFEAASYTNQRMIDYSLSMRRTVFARTARAVNELADQNGLVLVGMKDIAARTGAGVTPVRFALKDLARQGIITLEGQTSKRTIKVNHPPQQ